MMKREGEEKKFNDKDVDDESEISKTIFPIFFFDQKRNK